MHDPAGVEYPAWLSRLAKTAASCSPRSAKIPDQEDRDWQRLDKWLWCARFMRQRADCARLVAQGSVRINRQATEKAHARLRVGDVLTLPVHGTVRVLRVAALAVRRGPALEARSLYEEIAEADPDPS